MSDYIVRATAGNGSIRAFAATTRDWCSMQERFIIPLPLHLRHWAEC